MEVAETASQYIEQLAGMPFFLYVHLYDPHWSYIEHASEFTRWSNRAPVDLYDGEVLFTDRAIGRIVDKLKQKGLWQSTLLLVVADPGEEFGEHGGAFHGHTMYEENVRVPCVLKGPGLEPRTIDQPVMLFDFFPTLLDLLGVRWSGPVQGVSLEPLTLGRACRRGPIVGEMQPWTRDPPKPWLWMLVDGTDQLLYDVKANTYLLFDLATDPGERNSRVELDPTKFSRLQRLLQERVNAEVALPSGSEAASRLQFGSGNR